jgi:hypothetical protein
MIQPPLQYSQPAESDKWLAEGREIVHRHGLDNWRLGELAVNLHTAGQTDQQIADAWECSQTRVNNSRRVFQRFTIAMVKSQTAAYAWRSWVEMLSWEDAEDCIDFAAKNDWSFHDLQSWRAAKNGTQDPRQRSGPNQSGGDPASESLTGATGTTDPVRDVGTDAAPVSFPLATEPDAPIVQPAARKQPKATEPVVDLRVLLKAIRHVAETADAAQRVKTAKTLRKLANEIDPPKGMAAFVPPTLAEVAAYCSERGKGIDPESVIDWGMANGWKLSNGNQMRDWRAVVRTFEKREQTTNTAMVMTNMGVRNGRPSQNESIANLAAAAVGGSGPGSLMPDEATGNVFEGGVGLLDSDTRIV